MTERSGCWNARLTVDLNAKAAKAAKKYCLFFASFAASAFDREVRSGEKATLWQKRSGMKQIAARF